MFSLSLAKMKSRIEHFEKVLCVQTIQLIRCLLYPGNGVVVACSTIVASNPATEKIKLILAIQSFCIEHLPFVNCIEKTKIKEKRPLMNGPF